MNLIALLLVSLAAWLTALYLRSTTGSLAAVFAGFGFAIALMGWMQMRLREREELEQQEFNELKKSRGDSTLFSGAADTFRAKQSRAVFERWFVPGFSIKLLIVQG
ncbi:MAG TPA: hypothetical protein VMD57_04085, partial [Candidatus Baltobacteraceae bacterium]|nr:hypothetical protein [Candidatus Baltobacteraceae bacterium]